MADPRAGRYVVLVGIGSNIDPLVHIPEALAAARAVFSQVRVSRCYLTRPLRGRDQAPYVNGVFMATTDGARGWVCERLRELEDAAGRQRDSRDAYASRTLDLDLLLHMSTDSPGQAFTDPDLTRRDFVLIPAAELFPDFVDSVSGKTLRALADACAPVTILREVTMSCP